MEKKPSQRIVVIVMIVLVLAACAAVIFLFAAFKKNRSNKELAEHQTIVDSYRSKAYGRKYVGETDIGGQTRDQIQKLIENTMNKYKKRRISLIINGKTYRYSMKDVNEKIYYLCSDDTKYEAGQESELAQHLIDADKALPTEEQYDIIQGQKEPSSLSAYIQCECDRDAVTKIVKKYSKKYDISPKNATIDSNLKVTKERIGAVLDTSLIRKDLVKYLESDDDRDWENSYAAREIYPKIRAKELSKINTVISAYSTTFNANTPRGENIRIAAKRLDGTYLEPNEEISFLETLYDDSDGKKYEKSAGFLGTKVVQVEGGGICQVSSTAYDAFLFAGIIPKERHPHTCPVSYAAMGLDAALAVGVKDLVVENSFDSPMIIQAKVYKNRLQIRIASYKNATKGYKYQIRARHKSGSLTAKSYLDVYKAGKKVKTIHLSTDKYQKTTS